MSRYRDESLILYGLLNDFLNSVYLTSEEFFDTYGLFEWLSPEDTVIHIHKKFGVPMPPVPDAIEGLSDGEYAKIVYDAAKKLLDALEFNYDEDDPWYRELLEEYNIDLYKEYAQGIMDAMKEIMS